MKRYLFALFIAVFSFSIVSAQSSMTDEQIMQFVVKEHKAGASQSQIVTKLMQKGVDISQIRRIKAKYERLSKNGGLGLVMDETVGKAEETMRSNNGDTRESLGLAKNGKTKLKNKKKNGKNSKSSKDVNEKSSQRMGAVKSAKGKNVNGLPDEEDDELFDEMSNGVGDLLNDDMISEDMFLEDEDPTLYRGRKVFGRDIFNKEDLTFEPVMNIATPQSYVVGPGDEVLVPSLTFAASVNSIRYVGATPVFCDIIGSEHIPMFFLTNAKVFITCTPSQIYIKTVTYNHNCLHTISVFPVTHS